MHNPLGFCRILRGAEGPHHMTRLGIPYIDFGEKTEAILGRDVTAWLESKRRGGQ